MIGVPQLVEAAGQSEPAGDQAALSAVAAPASTVPVTAPLAPVAQQPPVIQVIIRPIRSIGNPSEEAAAPALTGNAGNVAALAADAEGVPQTAGEAAWSPDVEADDGTATYGEPADAAQPLANQPDSAYEQVETAEAEGNPPAAVAPAVAPVTVTPVTAPAAPPAAAVAPAAAQPATTTVASHASK